MDAKFKVGELVMFKSAIADCESSCRIGSFRLPSHYMVVERHEMECPGGVQYGYALRTRRDATYERINEVELVLALDVDLSKLVDLFLVGKKAMAAKGFDVNACEIDG